MVSFVGLGELIIELTESPFRNSVRYCALTNRVPPDV